MVLQPSAPVLNGTPAPVVGGAVDSTARVVYKPRDIIARNNRCAMASLTRILERRRQMKLARQGRRRKNRAARKSTQSYEELFAALGQPGQPAPPAGDKER
jgi:hypothetical protein